MKDEIERSEDRVAVCEESEALVDVGTRTKQFALRIIRLFEALPSGEVARTLGRQILRSGTSIGAQFREARRAKSDADFINKVQGALQELDETAYWLELLVEADIIKRPLLDPLQLECHELTAILVTIVKRVKAR
jgi:four helix bundle protein